MATTFPTSLQDLDATRGGNNDPLSTPNHSDHHALEDDTIEALQAKVGIDNSADSSSIDYKLTNASSSNPGHKHTLANGATDVTATATELNYVDGVTSNIQTQLDTLTTNANSRQLRSVLTTKGDIYVATASDTVTRLARGTDGQALKTNSSTSTGLEWANIAELDVQTFNSNGTWTKPTDAVKVLVQAWGAGGSGAKSNAGGNGVGGGGGGQYIEMWVDASVLSATESVTVGTGGAAISNNNTNGNNGSDSSFGSLLVANGGKSGITNSPANDGTGGDGGTPDYGSGNFMSVSGLWGAGGVEAVGVNGLYSAGGGGATLASTGYTGGNSIYGGAGGGGAGSSAGNGGTSILGGNGGAGSTSGTATSGSAPGGGGGGTVSSGNSGAGGSGRVIVTTFF